MILTCPNCTTRYLVDPASIGVFGRDVRCAKCHHEWFEPAPPPAENETPEMPPQPVITEMPDFSAFETQADEFESRRKKNSTNLPAVLEDAKTPIALIVAFVLLLIFTLFASATVYHRSIIKALPFTQGIYESFGLYPTKGLMLTDVKQTRMIKGANPTYEINCAIINTSKEPLHTPAMVISLLNNNNDIITSQKLSQASGSMIAAGEKQPCERIQIELVKRSKDAEKVRLDIGNSYDLWLRK